MNRTDEYLLDAAAALAAEQEFQQFTNADIPQTEIPFVLDKRVRGIIRKHTFTRFCKENLHLPAAVCLCILVLGILIGGPLYVNAREPDYYLLTEQEAYRDNMAVRFFCKNEDIVSHQSLKPRSVSEILSAFTLVSTYTAESVYIEEYDGVRYEQTILSAGGQYILPTKDKNIRNIVIGGHSAVLVFDSGNAAIVWQDGRYSYLMEGAISSDDAMRYARIICEE